MYPWATEDTVSRLAELARSNNIKSSALAVAIAQATNSSDVNAIKKLIDDSAKEIARTDRAAENASRKIKSQLKDAKSGLNSTDGIQAMADLTYAGAQAIDHLAGSVGNFGGRTSALGRAVSGAARTLTGAGVATAGISTIFAQLISAQEKTVRSMIDFGLVVNDDALFTELRNRVGNFAMGVEEYTGILEQTKQMMTGVAGDVYSGQVQMVNFLASAMDDETLSRFGYSPQEYALQLSQEAAMLYRVNQINSLNATDQRRVIDSFETANKLSLFLADNIGLQRSQAMAMRQEAEENLNYQLVMNRQTEYLNETFGNQASENVREANQFLYMLMNETIGQEMAQRTQDVLTGFVQDIRYDTSAVNNIPSELMQTLQRIGPEVAASYVRLIEDAGTGQITGQDMIMRFQEFARLIDQSEAKISVDEIGMEATNIRAQIATVPDEFFSITSDNLEEAMRTIGTTVDAAATAIDTVGNIAIAFRQTQNMITPGYESMASLFDVVSSSAEGFGTLWSTIFNIEGFRSPEERAAALNIRMIQQQAGVLGGSSAEYVRQVQEAQYRVMQAEQTVFRLEDEIDRAVETGDITRVEILYPQLEAAREELDEAQTALTEARSAPARGLSDRAAQLLSGNIGALSAQYESGQGAHEVGHDRTGGFSYGTYQIASNTGTFREYMDWLRTNDPDTYNRLQQAGGERAARSGSAAFQQAWAEIMSDPSAAQSQHDFIIASHYMPQVEAVIQRTGLDVTERSRALQDVLWSTSVQHRGQTPTIFERALSSLGSNPTDEEIIAAIYAERGSEGGRRYFPSSTAAIQRAVVNRFNNESRDALAMLAAERATASNPDTPVVSELRNEQTSLQEQINLLNQEISGNDDLTESELRELRSEMSRLEAELADVTDQLNSELASQNAAEAIP